jgi:hypothetical protein
MRKLSLLTLLLFMGGPLAVGCGGQRGNTVVEPNPDLDEAVETRRADVELETKP